MADRKQTTELQRGALPLSERAHQTSSRVLLMGCGAHLLSVTSAERGGEK